VSPHRLAREDHLVFIAVVSILVIASSLININGHYGTPKIAYSQSYRDLDQMNSNNMNLVDIQSVLLGRVSVGDFDIAYKTFGNGKEYFPLLYIILYNAGMTSLMLFILNYMISLWQLTLRTKVVITIPKILGCWNLANN
jgi:hypothetical protein